MPGIHVRTVSQLDWFEQGKESLLTVPGSYWLCHKKNIYKFTFKYHRTMRNTEKFQYGKELMKIIRRVIKCQPRQGQQFGTQNLLVTYNHTSWTRQDKMFAMLKFQERKDASAFSRAFVLTIKIYDSSADTSAHQRHSLDSFRTDQCDSMLSRNEHKSSTFEYVNTYIKDKVDECETITLNSNNFENISKFDTSYVNETKTKKDNAEKNVTTENASNESVIHLRDNKKPNSPNNEFETVGITEETVDSVNLPYQYLIEKEIEKSKQKSASDDDSLDNNTKNKSPCNFSEIRNSRNEETCNSLHTRKSNEERTSSMKTHKNDRRKYRNNRESDTSSTQQRNHVLRSSDITDLVMEGLMLTIRQGQDSVSVLEQKTKLEVDEVLENSEKVVTEEGEKCLLNSSLLKLENLITMIDLPEEGQQRGNNSIYRIDRSVDISDESLWKRKDYLNSTITSDLTSSKTSKDDKHNEKDIDDKLYIRNDTEDRQDDLEEDIIPEALQTDVYRMDDPTVSRDLLMDDEGGLEAQVPMKIETEKIPKYMKTSSLNNYIRNNTIRTSHLPRIVSSESITMDQIPEALRRVLNKSIDNTQCVNKNCEIKSKLDNKMDTSRKWTDTFSCDENSKPSTIVASNDKSTNTEFAVTVNDTETRIPHNVEHTNTIINLYETRNSSNVENVNSIANSNLKSKPQSHMETDRLMLVDESNTHEEIQESTSRMNASNCEEVQLVLPKNLQDITQEFYHELLQHQRKNSDRRSLRQRRKSCNNNNLKEQEIQIDMMKFIQHITHGAKVVVKRLSAENLSAVLSKSSSLATCIN